MKVAIFGANGGIGKFIVKHALEDGHQVVAYARNIDDIPVSNNLTIIKGELTDYKTIKNALSGCDAVISALGPPVRFTYEGTAVLDGHKNLIIAMDELRIKRLITLATPSVKFKEDRRSIITVIPGLIARIALRKARREIIDFVQAVTESDLEWTIVRIVAPKDSSFTGKVKVTFGDVKVKFSISREDIARFMLDACEKGEYIHSMPIIGS
jgi:putative NADH-flavin reductase